MSQPYFAYGSNLWLAQMQQRCPECSRVGIGILKRHLWIISKRGYATIIESENDEVHGIIYNISPSDEAELDGKEGVHIGVYYKAHLDVVSNGKNINCLVYIDPMNQQGKPKAEYVQRINSGLCDAELPDIYITKYIRKYIPAQNK